MKDEGNVFDLAEFRARRAERKMPYKSDFEARLERIKSSLGRINTLMKELREGSDENA